MSRVVHQHYGISAVIRGSSSAPSTSGCVLKSPPPQGVRGPSVCQATLPPRVVSGTDIAMAGRPWFTVRNALPGRFRGPTRRCITTQREGPATTSSSTTVVFWPDGLPMRHDQCPMAQTLREGRPVRGGMAFAERPDGTRIAFEAYPSPLRNQDGKLVGAITVLVDITERLAAVEALRSSANELRRSNAVKDEFLGLIARASAPGTRAPQVMRRLRETQESKGHIQAQGPRPPRRRGRPDLP